MRRLALAACLVLLATPASALHMGAGMQVHGGAISFWSPVGGAIAPVHAWGACEDPTAAADGCTCEPMGCDGPLDRPPLAEVDDGATVVSLHQAGALQVRHAWRTDGPDRYRLDVSFTNVGPKPIAEALYRWNLHPIATFDQHATGSRWDEAKLAETLRASGTGWNWTADPRAPFPAAPWAPPGACLEGPGSFSGGKLYNLTRAGCGGALADFLVGGLAPGASKSMAILHGVAATQAEAAALAAGSDFGFWFGKAAASRAPYVLFLGFTDWPASGGLAPATDLDRDGVADDADNCPMVPNGQSDWDRDGQGDACDPDLPPTPAMAAPAQRHSAARDADRDGILDEADVCPRVPDPAQADLDRDGQGDACDADLDGDGVGQAPAPFPDNCPTDPNPDQRDRDEDGAGDACDRTAAALPVGQPRSRTHGDGTAVQPQPPLAGAAAALLLLAAGLLAAAWARRRWLAGVALFSRIQPDRLLEHPVRAALAAAIDAQPGQATSSLARAVGVSRNAAEHHLRRLEKAGLVRLLRRRGAAWAFPPTADPETPWSEQGRRLAALVAERPGASVRDLADRAGLSYSAAYHHLRLLAQAGRLELRHDGGLAAFPAPPQPA